MLDIWRIILGYLQDDFSACMRLMVAVPGLHEQMDASFWLALERVVVHRSMYGIFVKVHRHLGRIRRLMRWASFCAVQCDACGMPMGETGCKLCARCQYGSMVSEDVTGTLPGIRFAWMLSPEGVRRRHYLWHDVFKNRGSAHLHT